jgi:hypothetical protein
MGTYDTGLGYKRRMGNYALVKGERSEAGRGRTSFRTGEGENDKRGGRHTAIDTWFLSYQRLAFVTVLTPG